MGQQKFSVNRDSQTCRVIKNCRRLINAILLKDETHIMIQSCFNETLTNGFIQRRNN